MKEEYSLGADGPIAITGCGSETKPSEKYFPQLHIDNAPMEFPKEGTMLVKFKRVRHTEDDKNETQSCCLEILACSDVKDTCECDGKTGMDKRGAELDKLKGGYEEDEE
jgi:hypothetical protein